MTKRDRNAIYKAALDWFVNERNPNGRLGICYAIYVALQRLGKWSYKTDPYFNMSKYKEIVKHKPKRNRKFWFPHTKRGTAKRISILKQAIKETE